MSRKENQGFDNERQAIQYTVKGNGPTIIEEDYRRRWTCWETAIEDMARAGVPNHCFVFEIVRTPDQKITVSPDSSWLSQEPKRKRLRRL
jgi:hypothetical protein